MLEKMETDERCVEEKCKDAQNIPFTFRLRLCSLPLFFFNLRARAEKERRKGAQGLIVRPLASS